MRKRDNEKLKTYVELIKQWNKRFNLIAGGDISKIWSRHIDDSLALIDIMPIEEKLKFFADLGTGCGLPGIPIKILKPDMQLMLVEKRERMCNFLRFVRAELELSDTSIYQGDVHRFHPSTKPDIVVSRAAFPPEKLLEIALPILKPFGYLIIMYGTGELAKNDFYELLDIQLRPQRKKNVLYRKLI